MNIDGAGIEFIKAQEGLRLTRYLDGAGNASIGYGHEIKPGEDLQTVTDQQAEAILGTDLEDIEKALTDLIEVDVSQCEFNALCSLAFNIGIGNFKDSTLLKLLNQQDYGGAACQFTRWCYITVGGKKIVSPALLERRHAEQSLFLGNSEGDPT